MTRKEADAKNYLTRNVLTQMHLMPSGDPCAYEQNEDGSIIYYFDPARVYPIILDPAVTTNDYSAGIMDIYVVENDLSGYHTSQFLSFNPMNGNDRIAVLKIQ